MLQLNLASVRPTDTQKRDGQAALPLESLQAGRLYRSRPSFDNSRGHHRGVAAPAALRQHAGSPLRSRNRAFPSAAVACLRITGRYRQHARRLEPVFGVRRQPRCADSWQAGCRALPGKEAAHGRQDLHQLQSPGRAVLPRAGDRAGGESKSATAGIGKSCRRWPHRALSSCW